MKREVVINLPLPINSHCLLGVSLMLTEFSSARPFVIFIFYMGKLRLREIK